MSFVSNAAGAERLVLRPQEIPLDHPESCCRFRSPLLATPAALEEFGFETIVEHLEILTRRAEQFGGLDRLQVFSDPAAPERRLWFIEDVGPEAHVTALLPEDY